MENKINEIKERLYKVEIDYKQENQRLKERLYKIESNYKYVYTENDIQGIVNDLRERFTILEWELKQLKNKQGKNKISFIQKIKKLYQLWKTI